MHKRPVADRFMKAVRDLRSRTASEEQAIGTAWSLYPDKTKDEANRSRLLRAFRATDESFRRAEDAYKAGANIVQIVAALNTSSSAGAPKGNLNALGKKQDDSIDRFNATWRGMTRAKQDEFLRTHGLSRIR